MPNNDPLRPDPTPFTPPAPQPFQAPDWNPAHRPPLEPPGTPNPVDPTRNPWQTPGAIISASAALLYATSATAATAGGGNMPWSTALQNISQDLSGPTAGALTLIGIVGVFGILIFGGELNHFARSLCFLVFCASMLVGASTGLNAMGITGATIDASGYSIGDILYCIIAAGCIFTAAISLYRMLATTHRAPDMTSALP